jgi:sulfate/thiosulfate-binding protein
MTLLPHLKPVAFGVLAAVFASSMALAADVTLLNVSYDPTRELYKDINSAFTKFWKKTAGEDVTVRMSHGGSGAQARSVIDGLKAHVVTLALEADIDAIASATNKIPADWKKRLPNNSAPYTSTIVFVVREGNPKNIKDWDDLAKPGVQVITPNPKTSGGARWNYLAAWGYAEAKDGDKQKAKEFVNALLKNVPVLDSGARGSTTTFLQRGLGDVLLAWENEAFLAMEEMKGAKLQIVVPSISIKAEPSVALVEGNLDNKTRKAAEAYLQFLYSDDGQRLAAKHFYRPSKPDAAKPEDMKRFPSLKLIDIDDKMFGGWTKAQQEHFADGGVFDQIYQAKQ